MFVAPSIRQPTIDEFNGFVSDDMSLFLFLHQLMGLINLIMRMEFSISRAPFPKFILPRSVLCLLFMYRLYDRYDDCWHEKDRSSEFELDDATAADQGGDRAGGDYSSSGVTRASSVESFDCAATSDDDEDDNDDEDISMAVPIEGAGDGRVNDGNPPGLDDADGGWFDVGDGDPQPPPPPPSSSSTTSRALHPHGNGGLDRRGRGSHSNSRSAAAAHRNRQIYIPPILSPGLLMLPGPANASENGRQRRLVVVMNDRTGENEEYILPSTVFRESMVAGGYTVDLRRGTHGPPSRGSSTERTVGDVFDCDAGPGMFLHFPDLFAALWDRRVGDDEGGGGRARKARREAEDGGPGGRPSGEGGGVGDGTPDVVCPRDADAPPLTPQKAGPKGARSSYIFFTNAQRPIMMMQFPGMRFTEQGVIMGERWRALTQEEKRPYEELAAADKERHAREMREYVEGVRREMEAGKTPTEDVSLMEWAQVKVQRSMVEQEGSKDASEDSAAEEMGGGDILMTMGEGGEVRGPRLVDAVILSLSRMLGEESSRRETPEGSVPSPEIQTEGFTSVVPAHVGPIASISRHVSTDLTLDELPSFTPPSTDPQTRPHPRPHVPMSFLDMIPVSLTATYPTSYVAKRLVYAQAVQAREEAIFAAQEAKDDADDEEEKYQAHVEAWERMLEYQKGQIAKREVEWRRERELSDAAEKGAGVEGGSDDGRKVAAEGSNDGGEDGTDETPNAGGSASGNDGCMEKKVRPTTPPPEDPMECMPPRPQRPGPPRDISIPHIPTPPSPPPTVMSDGENGRQLEMKGIDCEASVVQMMVPKVDQKLLRHLDQSCFLPTMLGRYFGLLSNHISDPQFCGILAPGVAGNTVGGGTGLATSYPGGGRGAVPVRGGGTSWHYSVAAGSKSGVEQSEKKSANEKILLPDEITSSEVAASPSAPAAAGTLSTVPRDSSLPTPACAKEKRLMSDVSTSPPSDKKNKKQKRATTFLLTTGDRNTSATEISSGSAGSEFPDGWLVKTYRRSGGETIGKTDRFWFSPGRNIRFRAKKHARAFVAILNEPDIDGDEDKAAEIYKTRGLHF
jgi:hypothetical protein